MERSQPPILPQKSSSFSFSAREEKKLRESDRNLSLGAIKLDDRYERKDRDATEAAIFEGEEGGERGGERDGLDVIKDSGDGSNAEEVNWDLATLFEEIDRFLAVLYSLGVGDGENQPPDPPEIPDTVEKFVVLVEKEIIKLESGESKWPSNEPNEPPPLLLDAIDRMSKLTAAFTAISSDHKYCETMNRSGSILHHAMSFLEDEFYSLLDDDGRPKPDTGNTGSKTKRPPSFGRTHELDRCTLPTTPARESSGVDVPPPYPPETVERLRSIAHAMISAGYETECCQVFSIARRNALEASLLNIGWEKISIDEIQRMGWDSLEGEIATWIKAIRQAVTIDFVNEQELYDAVFSDRPDLGRGLFCDLVRSVVVQLLNFPEAVAMTKRSAERLFKVLDMYETMRDVIPKLDGFFPSGVEGEEQEGEAPSSHLVDLKSEISSTWSRLGEAAASIFCDLESSIKADTGKTTVPGGAVHPLTRYVMNYLKYACEYMKTLEHIFYEHRKPEKLSSYDETEESEGRSNDSSSQRIGSKSGITGGGGGGDGQSPFETQLVAIMDLLHANLETKSKMYKDSALSNIFLMNNGRYIVQKIKSSAEINQVLGETWCRRKSSDLRQYHKNYQRETWSRVLACFKDDGLQSNGRVLKPVLKERFKSFNALFEDIHRTQSSWVVSDDQLQSELRVSVSAVVVPAYRSFLGRFSQYLDAGRQTEKYIKFAAEDLENYIDELFDGNPSSSIVRRRT